VPILVPLQSLLDVAMPTVSADYKSHQQHTNRVINNQSIFITGVDDAITVGGAELSVVFALNRYYIRVKCRKRSYCTDRTAVGIQLCASRSMNCEKINDLWSSIGYVLFDHI
jgi:hypothetical protein